MDAKANQMTDTSPLIQLKSGLQVLKSDVKSLDLRIGVAVSVQRYECVLRSKTNRLLFYTESYIIKI